jgi:molecular chaperone GrpE
MSSKKKSDVQEKMTDFFEAPAESAEAPEETVLNEPEQEETCTPDLKSQLDEMKDKYLRSLAEMENMKKRLSRDRESILKFGNEGLLRDMLRVYDSIDKSIQVAKKLHPEDANFIDGLIMVEKLFLETLKRHRVEPIDAKKGTPFNPNYHDAMLQRVDDEISEPDMVVDEFEKGFMLHDRVLRPAKVSVSIQQTT